MLFDRFGRRLLSPVVHVCVTEGLRRRVRVQRDDRATPLQHVLVGQVHGRQAHALPGAQQARAAAQSAGEGERAARQAVRVHAGADATGAGRPGGPAAGVPATGAGRMAGARPPAPSRVSAARGTGVAVQTPQVVGRPQVSDC